MLTDSAQRLLRIESKLDAILKHLNISWDPNEQIAKLAKERNTLGAIRLHRSCYNSNLSAAKKEVARLAAAK
jgi:hypothetical protein